MFEERTTDPICCIAKPSRTVEEGPTDTLMRRDCVLASQRFTLAVPVSDVCPEGTARPSAETASVELLTVKEKPTSPA